MDSLSTDTYSCISQFIAVPDILNCRLVNKTWSTEFSVDSVWRYHADQITDYQIPNKGLRVFVQKFAVAKLGSEQEIIEKMAHFLGRISWGINGKFVLLDNKRMPLIIIEIKATTESLPTFRQKQIVIEPHFVTTYRVTKAIDPLFSKPELSKFPGILEAEVIRKPDSPIETQLIIGDNGTAFSPLLGRTIVHSDALPFREIVPAQVKAAFLRIEEPRKLTESNFLNFLFQGGPSPFSVQDESKN